MRGMGGAGLRGAEIVEGLPWLRVLLVVVVALAALVVIFNKERDVHRTGAMRALMAASILGSVALVAVAAFQVFGNSGDAREALKAWERPAFGLGIVLSVAAAVVDRTTRAAKTHVGFAVPMLVMLTIFLLDAPDPVPVLHVARSIPVAFLGGLILGGVLRGLVRLVLPARTKART